VAGAIAQALAMSREERRDRHAALLHGILENDANKWQKDFLDALHCEDRSAEESRVAMELAVDRPRAGRRGIITGATRQVPI
jgi:trehalose-6-phosphate synthase